MTLDELLSSVIETLSGAGAPVLREFGEENIRRYRSPAVVLGIKGVSSRPAAFGSYAGSGSLGSHTCMRLSLSLSLDIFSHEGGSESDCRGVLSALCSMLPSLPSCLLSPSIEVGEARASGNRLLLPAVLSAEMISVFPEEEAPDLTDFNMKGTISI